MAVVAIAVASGGVGAWSPWADAAYSRPGMYFADRDGDGFGDWYDYIFAASRPAGWVANNNDCNDNAAEVRPGATTPERAFGQPYDDYNCDARSGADAQAPYRFDRDRDGFPSGDPAELRLLSIKETRTTVNVEKAALSLDWAGTAFDCDDANASIGNNFGKCANGARSFGLDADGDGHRADVDDCADHDPRRFPGRAEVFDAADPAGHDEDCDRKTGGPWAFDPNWRDPRKAYELGAREGRQLHPWDSEFPRYVRPAL